MRREVSEEGIRTDQRISGPRKMGFGTNYEKRGSQGNARLRTKKNKGGLERRDIAST